MGRKKQREQRERRQSQRVEASSQRREERELYRLTHDTKGYVNGNHYKNAEVAMGRLELYISRLDNAAQGSDLDLDPQTFLAEDRSFERAKKPFKAALDAIVSNLATLYQDPDADSYAELRKVSSTLLEKLKPIAQIYCDAKRNDIGLSHLNSAIQDYIRRLPEMIKTDPGKEVTGKGSENYSGWLWIQALESKVVLLCGKDLEVSDALKKQFAYFEVDTIRGVDFFYGILKDSAWFKDPEQIFADYRLQRETLSFNLTPGCLRRAFIKPWIESVAQNYLNRER